MGWEGRGGCLKYGRLEHSNVPLKHCKQNINLFCNCVSRKRAELGQGLNKYEVTGGAHLQQHTTQSESLTQRHMLHA